MQHNIICNSCKTSFYLSSYTSKYMGGKWYFKSNSPCPKCKSFDLSIISKKRNFSKGAASFGKFSSASDEKKKEILNKRAQDHYNKSGKEQKREYFKNAMRKL